LLINICKRRK